MTIDHPDIEYERLVGDNDLSDAHEVRRRVFVDEQGIVTAEEDRDGLDLEAEHYVGYDGDNPVVVARVRCPKPGIAKIERVATLDSHRSRGIGGELTERIIDDLRRDGVSLATLNAQREAEGFYLLHGFTTVSEPFEEAGVPHVRMERQIGMTRRLDLENTGSSGASGIAGTFI